MSSRTRIRPRKVYDSIFTLGESYYKPAIDRLDRKYSGRPSSPAKQSSVPREIAERHAEAFADDDLSTARRRAEKHISEDNFYDKRTIGLRPVSAALNLDDEIGEDVASSLQKIQARRRMLAANMVDDVDMENTFNNLSAHRMVSRTEKLLDSVGLNESSARRMFDEESSVRRRTVKVTADKSDSSVTKWTALRDTEDETSAAVLRARQSRARLNDLDEEMEAMAEKQAARAKRMANLRALMAENAEESEALQTKTARLTSRIEKKIVTF